MLTNKKMKAGKISPLDFQHIFQGKFGAKNPKLRVSSAFGIDTSIIDLEEGLSMASASDPLSYIPFLEPEKSAALSVHLIANDLATTSVMPQFFQMVLNLNEHFQEEEFKIYWECLHQICCELGISITGGHTGVVAGINSTIIGGGTMFSVAKSNQFLSSCQAKEGNVLCMSKKAAISSTAILGLSFPEVMKSIFGTDKKEYFNKLFGQISVYKEGKLASKLNKEVKKIHAMHDVTEGGVLGAIYEMCTASKLGVAIDKNNIFSDEIQQKVCEYFNIQPSEIIGAGSMLFAIEKRCLNEVLDTYNQENIPLIVLGEFQAESYGMKLSSDEGITELTYQDKDPYWDAFYKQYVKSYL